MGGVQHKSKMDSVLKIKYTIDALFGIGISKNLPKDLRFTYSKKRGRIQHVYENDILLCTLRTDGGLAITPYFAQILMKSTKFRENCVEVDDDSKPFIENGNSVFSKHVVSCGKNILIGSDVPVLYRNRVIAVGKAMLSTRMIKSFKKGVAVKVRDSLKSLD
ncbi:tRNA-guanine(15) transglycosylase [uncultured archaeon]|nr:tRNA-guanine(15) transglycosylase [uncultured archaeon]